MNWGSATEFFAMGGYGLFVWGSYGMVAVWMLCEPFLARSRLRAAQKQNMEEHLKDATDEAST